MTKPSDKSENTAGGTPKDSKPTKAPKSETVEEVGGRDGPDPTRYGDWERKGILSDF